MTALKRTLQRIVDQEPVVIPDSQPLYEVRPPSPSPAEHLVFPRFQFRVGKRDWANELLIDLKDHIDTFSQFLERKKNPEVNNRINLRDFPENDIIRKFIDLEKILWKSKRNEYLFLPEKLPPGVHMDLKFVLGGPLVSILLLWFYSAVLQNVKP